MALIGTQNERGTFGIYDGFLISRGFVGIILSVQFGLIYRAIRAWRFARD
ncbi:hypothetical protein BRPE64_DCDS01700 (plasmid) [Caballeronia insecticola]|uniref:Uncharacterized protein n=1 Tax=Caballeronia insecticola TaxID=758793 RepID=R4X340_9BURK|nr:hypothetical protein BRPE64_DCDS01700 [Caballeronia insecticola]